jgi:hypothetical protein
MHITVWGKKDPIDGSDMLLVGPATKAEVKSVLISARKRGYRHFEVSAGTGKNTKEMWNTFISPWITQEWNLWGVYDVEF